MALSPFVIFPKQLESYTCDKSWVKHYCVRLNLGEDPPLTPSSKEQFSGEAEVTLSHTYIHISFFLTSKYHQLSISIHHGGIKNSLKRENHKQSLDFHVVTFIPPHLEAIS